MSPDRASRYERAIPGADVVVVEAPEVVVAACVVVTSTSSSPQAVKTRVRARKRMAAVPAAPRWWCRMVMVFSSGVGPRSPRYEGDSPRGHP